MALLFFRLPFCTRLKQKPYQNFFLLILRLWREIYPGYFFSTYIQVLLRGLHFLRATLNSFFYRIICIFFFLDREICCLHKTLFLVLFHCNKYMSSSPHISPVCVVQYLAAQRERCKLIRRTLEIQRYAFCQSCDVSLIGDK